ncbi:uncharacterized protein PV09_07853 [Verruconis gallopava]|uniref:Calcium uniporter protein n=1 Tax=Verruconis gallopava TaxID=253628 RepID=A0A0D1XEP2_9PEZI|nr:uncharacterized protein PV09_07853 [Verruconis gallopava]KIW00666.1 hypothetical protein PV09_07853 [Verruconis gallopava]
MMAAISACSQPRATTSLLRRTTKSLDYPRVSQRSWLRTFHKSSRLRIQEKQASTSSWPASELHQEPLHEELSHFDRAVAEDKARQIRTPWMREGSDKPPVARQRSAGAMTKGKLLTTPSRMLKLILPLTTRDTNTDRKDVEPLALLVHPQQPLSYLERLVQSELPMIKDENGKEKIPSVHFRAEDSMQENEKGHKGRNGDEDEVKDEADLDEHADEVEIDGKKIRTGKLNGAKNETVSATELRGGPGEGGVESYSGLGHEAKPSKEPEARRFVRWSKSTEIGDFIRDAARGKEFAIEIEGAPNEIRVGVPSFADRTYYLRLRLRKKASEIAKMAELKRECDEIAHRAAKRVAMAGGLGLVAWWGVVYELTFRTELGWDVMEPVTYLVGLSTLIGGYGWFLIHNRQVSYRSAMNFTISRRQSQLYEKKGFDLRKWEDLIEEGNMLRREIKAVAQEYDVDWDEKEDEKSERVMQALKEERRKKSAKKKEKEQDDGDGDNDE